MNRLMFLIAAAALSAPAQTTTQFPATFTPAGTWMICSLVPALAGSPLCAAIPAPGAEPWMLNVHAQNPQTIGFDYRVTGFRLDGSVIDVSGYFTREDNFYGYSQAILAIGIVLSPVVTVTEHLPGPVQEVLQ